MAGIKDVAQHAGVSISTVSRVLNGHENISQAKKEAVLKAAEALGYSPNAVAASLRRKSSNVVGVLIANQSSPFGSTLHTAIEAALAEKGYLAMVCSTLSQVKREREYIRVLMEMQVGGVIIRPASGTLSNTARHAALLQRAGISVVYVETTPTKSRATSSVISGSFSGGQMAIRKLFDLGHRDIAILIRGYDRRHTSTNPVTLRLKGALEEARRLGISNRILIKEGFPGQRFDFGHGAMASVLETDPQVTAVFASTDLIGIGAISAIREAGLDVPTDISVIGYDGLAISEMTLPAMTTISQRIDDMGQKAVNLMIEPFDQQRRQATRNHPGTTADRARKHRLCSNMLTPTKKQDPK
ncbi:LacI family DNA-binding transcriptional regulator [uncultured Cohaesibacter sp.]|uniref:LacI family DNA-binding transcriptional regulator n=1 Tax=uncultured Cohaesibacter sp. TaxID=1002546 RepID=UPI00293180D8|nr:LacI family DNA-binding transcriptional regulator [uncultured Cohaesibacter sp.]